MRCWRRAFYRITHSHPLCVVSSILVNDVHAVSSSCRYITTNHSSSSADASSGECSNSTAMSSSTSAVATTSSSQTTAVSDAKKDRKIIGGDSERHTRSSIKKKGTATSVGTPGKVSRVPHTSIKVKKKAPWGAQQLRDSWSEDAMTKRDTDNMTERIHREYRYHPEEFRRHWIKYAAFGTFPLVIVVACISYYVNTGQHIWHGDPQHILNLIRLLDTSPRSMLYAYKLEETMELPEHIVRYREKNMWKRVEAERIFKITGSAYAKPTEMQLRQIQLEDEEQPAKEDEQAESAVVASIEGGGA